MIIAKPKNSSSASIPQPLCWNTSTPPPRTPSKEFINKPVPPGHTSTSLSSNDSAFVEDLEENQLFVQPLKSAHKDTPFVGILNNSNIIDFTMSSRTKVSLSARATAAIKRTLSKILKKLATAGKEHVSMHSFYQILNARGIAYFKRTRNS